VAHLQAHGSGQGFAQNARNAAAHRATHYEPKEHGYDSAVCSGACVAYATCGDGAPSCAGDGRPLRFGFEVTYGKDLKAMRDDNGADYPWLNFALGVWLDEYGRLVENRGARVWFDRWWRASSTH
jgi:hypothetical protein